jgi:hypothetical protein
VQFANVAASFVYQPNQPASALWFPTTRHELPNLPDPVPIHQPRFLAAPFLAAFSQNTTPWTFPMGRHELPPLPEPVPIHQPRILPAAFLTGGVLPNPTDWVSYARRSEVAPPPFVPVQGVDEPSRRSVGFIFPRTVRPLKRAGVVPHDEREKNPVLRRHEQITAQVINTLIQAGDLLHEQGSPQAPWRLGYNAAVDTDWTGPVPANLADAIDRIAAALAALGQKP